MPCSLIVISEDPDAAVPAQRDASGRPSALALAYQRVMDSYELARRLVYDRYPGGLPPREQLTPEELGLLEEFELAERTLDELRRNEWA